MRTGRSPSGNLRNFGAMAPVKFNSVYTAVMSEQDDPEAMRELERWARLRNSFPNPRPYDAVPEGVTEEEWFILKRLAGVA